MEGFVPRIVTFRVPRGVFAGGVWGQVQVGGGVAGCRQKSSLRIWGWGLGENLILIKDQQVGGSRSYPFGNSTSSWQKKPPKDLFCSTSVQSEKGEGSVIDLGPFEMLSHKFLFF